MSSALDLTHVENERARQGLILLISCLEEMEAFTAQHFQTAWESLQLYTQKEYEQALVMAWLAIETCHESQVKGLLWRHASLCQRQLGKLAEAASSLREAIQALRELPVAIGQSKYALAICLDDLADALQELGQEAEAKVVRAEAREVLGERPPDPRFGLLLSAGENLHRCGHCGEALETYTQALPWARTKAEQALLLARQADLYQDVLQNKLAHQLYLQALESLDLEEDRVLIRHISLALANLARRAKDYDEAGRWLDRVATQANFPLPEVEILRGIFLAEQGDTEAGLQKLSQACLELEQSGGALADLALALLRRAIVEFTSGEQVIALRSLAQALMVADHAGHYQMLVGEVPTASSLLAVGREQPEISKQVEALLERAAACARQLPGEPAALRLQVRTLGETQIIFDSRPIPLKGRSLEALLFFIEQAPVSREVVLQTLWPEATKINTIYQRLNRLHEALEYKLIVMDDQVCHLAPDIQLEYDAGHFQMEAETILSQMARLQRLEKLSSVAQLYTGDYLAHLPVGDWALERRNELRHLYVEVLNALARELLSQGSPLEAHPTLLKAVEIEPTHEGVAETMLKCLSALGRRSEASLYYRDYCLKLDAMFGVAPPQHIRELYTQLIS